MNPITRRSAMAGSAAVVAAVPVALTLPAKAEDRVAAGHAELRELWGEWCAVWSALVENYKREREVRRAGCAEVEHLRATPPGPAYEKYDRARSDAIKRRGICDLQHEADVLRSRLACLRASIKCVPAETIFGVGVRFVAGIHFAEDHWEVSMETLSALGRLSRTEFRAHCRCRPYELTLGNAGGRPSAGPFFCVDG